MMKIQSWDISGLEKAATHTKEVERLCAILGLGAYARLLGDAAYHISNALAKLRDAYEDQNLSQS